MALIPHILCVFPFWKISSLRVLLRQMVLAGLWDVGLRTAHRPAGGPALLGPQWGADSTCCVLRSVLSDPLRPRGLCLAGSSVPGTRQARTRSG